MSTVELLEEALRVARGLGYRVRPEALGGVDGGACEIRGQKWFFLDLDLPVEEQLECLLVALRGEPALKQRVLTSLGASDALERAA